MADKLQVFSGDFSRYMEKAGIPLRYTNNCVQLFRYHQVDLEILPDEATKDLDMEEVVQSVFDKNEAEEDFVAKSDADQRYLSQDNTTQNGSVQVPIDPCLFTSEADEDTEIEYIHVPHSIRSERDVRNLNDETSEVCEPEQVVEHHMNPGDRVRDPPASNASLDVCIICEERTLETVSTLIQRIRMSSGRSINSIVWLGKLEIFRP